MDEVLKQYFPVVLFIMLHKVVLTFEAMDEILKQDFPVMLFLGSFDESA